MAKLRGIIPEKLLEYEIERGIDLISNELWIDGQIDQELSSFWIRALSHMLRINPQTPITVNINSFGGCCYGALALHDFIYKHRDRINTHAVGHVGSAAIDVYLAGGRRTSEDTTTFMMHAASGVTEGKSFAMKVDVEETLRIEEIGLNIYAKQTNKSYSFWKKKLNYKDFYFNKLHAVELGVVNDF